jgi:hypothetical protein
MHEIRRIGNTICVDGIPVADFRLRTNGTERGLDWIVWRETWICRDTIYCDYDPVADIRPTARPFEREALARWLDPRGGSLSSLFPTRIGSLIHQSHFASEASSHMVAGL